MREHQQRDCRIRLRSGTAVFSPGVPGGITFDSRNRTLAARSFTWTRRFEEGTHPIVLEVRLDAANPPVSMSIVGWTMDITVLEAL